MRATKEKGGLPPGSGETGTDPGPTHDIVPVYPI